MNIVPHLWFDNQAAEAAAFYTSMLPDSRITATTVLRDTPSGDCELVAFDLWGQPFEAISGGPQFQFNPAISFILNFDPLLFGTCDAAKTSAMEAQTHAWAKLTSEGQVVVPLDAYPFSERFGWVLDKYGVSWQLILSRPEGDRRPPIVPSLIFGGANYGRAEEARAFYLSVFDNGKVGGQIIRGPGQEPEREGTMLFGDFAVENFWLALMDNIQEENHTFNESISFMVRCDSQAEIDRLWAALNTSPDGGQCGWLQDKYGVSWQIVPASLHDLIYNGTDASRAAIMQALLAMKKLDLAALQAAAGAVPGQ